MRTSRLENLNKFKFLKPTKIEFKFTPQQDKDINKESDNADSIGSPENDDPRRKRRRSSASS